MKKNIVLIFVVFMLAAMSVVSVSANASDEYCQMLDNGGFIDSSFSCAMSSDGSCRCITLIPFGISAQNDEKIMESWCVAEELAVALDTNIMCEIEPFGFVCR